MLKSRELDNFNFKVSCALDKIKKSSFSNNKADLVDNYVIYLQQAFKDGIITLEEKKQYIKKISQ